MDFGKNYTRVFVRDHAIELRVGVRAHEKHAPQTVIINIECEAANVHRFDDPTEESLDRAINYSLVHKFIAAELSVMPHIPLLESVAEIIADFCLRDPRISKVRVRLEKPKVLPGIAGAGVEDSSRTEDDMKKADNKWALITGAAQRIGRVIALEMAQAGWNIIVHYNTSRTEAEKTAHEIETLGRKVCLAELNLSNLPLVKKLIPSLSKELGPITALINNASIFVPDETEPDAFVFAAINVEAPRLLGEALWKQTPLSQAGAIVNILDADPTVPAFSFYNQSKKVLADMTIALAKTYAPTMRINGIALGPVLRTHCQSDQHFEKLVQKTPLGKPVKPQDVAHAVCFLTENSAITGAIIPIDGGLHLKDKKV